MRERSRRSNESGGEFVLLQEMTGRKPEGGEERELIQLFHTQGEQKQRLQGPLGALKKKKKRDKIEGRHIKALFKLFLHTLSRVLTLQNASPSCPQQLCCPSFITLWAFVLIFFSPPLPSPLFRRQLVPPLLLSSPKGFPICFRLPLAAVG